MSHGGPVPFCEPCAMGYSCPAHDPRPRPIADGQKCINCQMPARGGTINHMKTCPDWTTKKAGK
jgi:hypothetical protein